MTVPRMVAVGFILFVAAVAWMVLGGATDSRTRQADNELHGQVAGLWGRPQSQAAPRFSVSGSGGKKALQPSGSDISATFDLDQRRKGLLWYATYAVDFDAAYRLRNTEPTAAADVEMRFPFPDPAGAYDGFAATINGKPMRVDYVEGEARAFFRIPAEEDVEVRIVYGTNGIDQWRYAPTAEVGVIEDFSLVMETDFDDIDFPGDSVSPSTKERSGEGWRLTWDYDSLVSGRPIAITMPRPLNPGPVAARISFFAPVSLLFYFAALLLLGATGGLKVHPMNYAFLAAGFFAFHLLFTYLADQVPVWAAFGVASAVSLGLCVGYLGVVVGRGRALLETAIGQFVFLVLFSFSFFFDGFTGLAITVGSVLTLAFFMAKTARTDWDEVFARGREVGLPQSPCAPAPPSAPAPEAPQA